MVLKKIAWNPSSSLSCLRDWGWWKWRLFFVIERFLSEDTSHNTPTWDLMTLHLAYNLVRKHVFFLKWIREQNGVVVKMVSRCLCSQSGFPCYGFFSSVMSRLWCWGYQPPCFVMLFCLSAEVAHKLVWSSWRFRWLWSKLVMVSCSQSCHNIGRCFGDGILPAVFRAARPGSFLVWKLVPLSRAF